MSSSSSSARSASSSSVSYTYGIPGSQVTLILNKSGNHSAILSRGNSKTSSSIPVGTRKFPDGFVGPADMPFCKVCYDAGLPVADYTNHFVKNQPGPDGKVVCPTLLAQKCLICGVAGHTSSYCTQTIQRKKEERTVRSRDEYEQSKKASGGWETVGQKGAVAKSKPRIEDMEPSSKSSKPATKPAVVTVSKSYGAFSALAVEDSSDVEREEQEICNTPAGVPKPVRKEAEILTGPPPAVESAKPLTWAQRAAAAAQKPAPSSSSFTSSAPLTDTRFQLHALCDRVEQSKRASATKKTVPVAVETANHRGAAAAVASESSMKRKQNSAMVPA